MTIRLRLAQWVSAARRQAAIVAALTFLLGVLAGCENPANPGGANAGSTTGGGASGKVRRVIMMTNGADPFWDAMRAGMAKAEKDFDLASVKLEAVMDVGDGTSAAQIATAVDRNLKTGKLRKPEEAIAALVTALSAANAG